MKARKSTDNFGLGYQDEDDDDEIRVDSTRISSTREEV